MAEERNNHQHTTTTGLENQLIIASIIGCGDVCDQYIQNMIAFDFLKVKSAADINLGKAEETAKKFNIKATPTEAMLNDPEIDLVVNLTPPAAHTDINLKIISAGKHLYSEKPLGANRDEVALILTSANDKGVLVGSAPDHFMGPSLQAARRLIDDGEIGDVLAAMAFLATRGPELSHPNPGIFYRAAAGPLYDLGPYCLTALVSLMGPVARVCGSAQMLIPKRTVQNGSAAGSVIQSEVPTHASAVIDYETGAVGTVTVSFDVWSAKHPLVEIFGSKGTISIPGPHKYTSPVHLLKAGETKWSDVPLPDIQSAGRGLGAADLARAVLTNYKPRASGELAYHVTDILQAIEEASASGSFRRIKSRCERPEPLY